MLKPDSVAILGAGLMGHGIAQVFLSRGYEVSIYDPAQYILDEVPGKISENLLDTNQDIASLDNLRLCSLLSDAVRNAEFIFEAVPEKLGIKQKLFSEVEELAPADAVLASNTSVIPITQIGSLLKQGTRQRIIGTHWWNPPFLIPVVEVIRTEELSEEVFSRTMQLLIDAGKVPVEIKKDVPGFVGNRLQVALWREAFALVNSGVCDAATVDTVVKNTFGMRLPVLGPLENADMIGLDLTLDIFNVILPHLDASKTPAPILSALVSNRDLGMKSGKGLRSWSYPEAQALRQKLLNHLSEFTNKT